MKRNWLYVLVIIAVTLSVWGGMPAEKAYAATCTSQATGDWGTSGTWTGCGGVIPTASDDVVIANGHVVTISSTTARVARTVTIQSGGTLEFASGATALLTITPLNATIAFDLQSGGTFTSNGSGTIRVNVVSGASNSISGSPVFNNLTLSRVSGTRGTVNFTGTTLTVNGTLQINTTTTLNASGKTVYIGTLSFTNTASTATEQIADLNGSTVTIGNAVTVSGGAATFGRTDLSNTNTRITGNLNLNQATGANPWNFAGSTVALSGTSEQTIVGTNVITFSNLAITNTVGVVIPTINTPVVIGTFVNSGTLKQAQTVGASANDVKFLEITDSASTVKYHGVEITNTTTSDMGAVTVTVKGNQPCTTDAASAPIQRCFNIAPTTPATATIKFWYTSSELNGNNLADLKVYHWAGSWISYTTGIVTGTEGSDSFIQVEGMDSFSPFVLDDYTDGPTAITLRDLTASSPASLLPVVLGVFGLFAGGLLLRRRTLRTTPN